MPKSRQVRGAMFLFIITAVIIGHVDCLPTSNKVYTLFSDRRVTWNEALTICSERGMSMVTPVTQDSQDALFDFFKYSWMRFLGPRQHYWTSLHSVDGDTDGLFNDRCDYLPVTGDNRSQFGTWSGSRCWRAQLNRDLTMRAEQCSTLLFAICERTEGNCSFRALLDTSLQKTIRSQSNQTENLLQCGGQCLRSVTSDNMECWGVAYNNATENCTMYFTNARHQLTSAETLPRGIDLHIKTCHEVRLDNSRLTTTTTTALEVSIPSACSRTTRTSPPTQTAVAAHQGNIGNLDGSNVNPVSPDGGSLGCCGVNTHSAATPDATYTAKKQPTTASQDNDDLTHLTTSTPETPTPMASSETQKTTAAAQLSLSTTTEPSTSIGNTALETPAPWTTDTVTAPPVSGSPLGEGTHSSVKAAGEKPSTVESSAQVTGATSQATGETTDNTTTTSGGTPWNTSIGREMVSETTPNEDLCPCPCHSDITPEEKEIFLESLLSPLHLNVTNISSTKRRYVSAPDDRMSATSIGVFGGVLLAVPFVIILLSDLITLKRHLIG